MIGKAHMRQLQSQGSAREQQQLKHHHHHLKLGEKENGYRWGTSGGSGGSGSNK